MTSQTYRIILWASVIGALVLVVFGLVWLANGGGQKQVYIPAVNEILADDHVFGKTDSTVTLVEYADYQCPACALYYSIIKKVEDVYGNRVRFVYRNFPIPGHTNGIPAAYAAEAAALQGKFYEMIDKIYTQQAEWSSMDSGALAKTLDGYAQEIGLDMEKFKADKGSETVRTKVNTDAKSGVRAGVNSTPTFFLNGVQIQAQSYEQFASELDKALKQ